MGKASLIHDTINVRLREDDSLALCERPFLHVLLQNKLCIMFIQQSRTPTLLASPPLRFPSLTLTHLALWAAPAVRSGQRRVGWRCDEQTPDVGDTHSDAHNEANARAPTPREGNYFCSSPGFIFRLSLVRNSARSIEDGCPSGRGMITQSWSPMTFPASSVTLIPFPAE